MTNIIETSKHFNGLTHNELVSKYVLGLKDKFSDHVCLKMFTFDFILIVKSDIPVHTDNENDDMTFVSPH